MVSGVCIPTQERGNEMRVSSFLIRLPVHEGFAGEAAPEVTPEVGPKLGSSRDQALVLQACGEDPASDHFRGARKLIGVSV